MISLFLRYSYNFNADKFLGLVTTDQWVLVDPQLKQFNN